MGARARAPAACFGPGSTAAFPGEGRLAAAVARERGPESGPAAFGETAPEGGGASSDGRPSPMPLPPTREAAWAGAAESRPPVRLIPRSGLAGELGGRGQQTEPGEDVAGQGIAGVNAVFEAFQARAVSVVVMSFRLGAAASMHGLHGRLQMIKGLGLGGQKRPARVGQRLPPAVLAVS